MAIGPSGEQLRDTPMWISNGTINKFNSPDLNFKTKKMLRQQGKFEECPGT